MSLSGRTIEEELERTWNTLRTEVSNMETALNVLKFAVKDREEQVAEAQLILMKQSAENAWRQLPLILLMKQIIEKQVGL